MSDSTTTSLPDAEQDPLPIRHTYTVLFLIPDLSVADLSQALRECDIRPVFIGHSAIFLPASSPTPKPFTHIAIFPTSLVPLLNSSFKAIQRWCFTIEASQAFDDHVNGDATEFAQDNANIEIADKQLAQALKMWRRERRAAGWLNADSRVYVLDFVRVPGDNVTEQLDVDYGKRLFHVCEDEDAHGKVHLTGKFGEWFPMEELDSSGAVTKEYCVSRPDVFTLMSFPSTDHYNTFRNRMQQEIGKDDGGTDNEELHTWSILTRKAYFSRDDEEKGVTQRKKNSRVLEAEQEDRRKWSRRYDDDWFG